MRAIEDWKAAHNGQAPTAYKDRNALKALITSQKRTADDENFDEAVAPGRQAG